MRIKSVSALPVYVGILAIAAILSYQVISTYAVSSNNVAYINNKSEVMACDYIIYQIETGNPRTVEAKDCNNGQVVSSNTNAATVFNYVMTQINSKDGGSVYVKGFSTSHPYNITSAIAIPDSGHLTIYGDGPEHTVLQVPSGSDNNIFEYTGAKTKNAFFNAFRDFELVGNKGTGGVTNSGFYLNATGGFGITDSQWFNLFFRDFARDDVYLYGGSSWNNRFESNTFEHAGRASLYRDGGLLASDIKVINNKFLYNDGYGVYDTGTFGTYIGNWFYRNNQHGMYTTDTFSKNIIEGNRFQNDGYGTNNAYTDLYMFQSDYNTVTGNVFYGSDNGNNYVKYGIFIDSFATQNLISGNSFLAGNFGTAKIGLGTSTQSSIIRDNAGWNPYGVVASPFLTTQNTIIPLGGNAAAPSASTDYIVRTTPILITSSGGTGVSITIKDAGGNTVASGLTTLSGMYVPVGYKVNFGAFSVAPTVTVGFN